MKSQTDYKSSVYTMEKGTSHKLANVSMACKCTCAIFFGVLHSADSSGEWKISKSICYLLLFFVRFFFGMPASRKPIPMQTWRLTDRYTTHCPKIFSKNPMIQFVFYLSVWAFHVFRNEIVCILFPNRHHSLKTDSNLCEKYSVELRGPRADWKLEKNFRLYNFKLQ